MAAYKMAALQRASEESVPSSELERANRQYTELTVKYRDMLQRDNHLVQRTTGLEHLEVGKATPCFCFGFSSHFRSTFPVILDLCRSVLLIF